MLRVRRAVRALPSALFVLALIALVAAPALAAKVTFHLAAPGAKKVNVAGGFNSWSDSATPLADPDGKGIWTATVEVPAGKQQYKFVVDGQWKADPANAEKADDGFGGSNSVVTVGDKPLEVGPALREATVVAPTGSGPVTITPAGGVAVPAGKVAVTFGYKPGGKPGAVHLAGEMNNWNADGELLTDPDGDGLYTVTVPLAPGRYQYKFVIDGQWKQDAFNPKGQDDGFGGQNSVVEVPAGVTEFALGGAKPGGASDTAVVAAGGAVAAAPAAPSAPAGQANVEFRCQARVGAQVFLAGTFNSWSPNATALKDADGKGSFAVTIPLAPGSYQYKFVIDGQWKQDASNPKGQDDGFGGQNSLLEVPAGAAAVKAGGATVGAAGGGAAAGAGGAVAPAAAGAGVKSVGFKFTPVISGVTNVFLAGSFNDWNDSKTRMTDANKDGTYEVTLLLPPGSYQYKFVVDGQWKPDPNNPAGAPDGFGGQNSVLRVDDTFAGVEIKLGDGKVFTDDIVPAFDYSTCNPLSPTRIELTARAHKDDVQDVFAICRVNGGAFTEQEMIPAESDPAYRYYRATIELKAATDKLEYAIRYRDGKGVVYLGPGGFGDNAPDRLFTYTAGVLPPFTTPDWARDGVCYQIFADRFANGDPRNDPDFTEPWYQGRNGLPASGRTNDEYFHLVSDWYDVSGLTHSPYRTDGKPDWYSFYGGDIAGVKQKLGYLADLGVSVIYFNPLNQAPSNHKYDPTDYLKIDPHFAGEPEFREFVKDAHAHGIRIIVDMAFNHTGNWHWAFRDCVEKGDKSPYWNWYEWKRWPLPDTKDFKAADYYDCWWGFGIHPNLNYDLSRPNAAENNVEDIAQTQPCQGVVDYVLKAPQYWLGDLGIDGFRLDVPNEVPFWFWRLFREACYKVKPDAYLVGELWGNAQKWIGPRCFDATMNYKFFRDPVMEFFGQSGIDAAAFDQRLAPGRFQYPPQAVAVMMNLIDSHDTVRYLTATGDVRRLMLAAMFSLTYVGMPTIWYGDEIGTLGDKDPDCRRPFDWRYTGDPRRVALHDFYKTVAGLRRANPALTRGRFTTLATQGTGYAFARTLGDKAVVALFNGGNAPAQITLRPGDLSALLPGRAGAKLRVIVGPESFPQTAGAGLKAGDALEFGGRDLTVTLPALSGAILQN